MADLNTNQIQDNLKAIFDDENRVVVFWYDGDMEFEETLSSLKLDNVKIYHLEKDNIFKTKVLLEVIDKESDYLIYAPFKRPKDEDNYLIDIIKYSKVFMAEMTALILTQLNISLDYQDVLDEHKEFFFSKDRKNKYINLLLDYHNVSEDTLRLAMMGVLLNISMVDLDLLVSKLISLDLEKRNVYFSNLGKYNLVDEFWKMMRKEYGYDDSDYSIDRFIIGLFARYADIESPRLNLSGTLNYNINDRARVRRLIDNYLSEETLIKTNRQVYSYLKDNSVFSDIESIINVRIFEEIDLRIIDWMIDRIILQQYDIEIKGQNLLETIDYRTSGLLSTYNLEYVFLRNVLNFNKYVGTDDASTFNEVLKAYVTTNYKVDYYYREVISTYENLENQDKFEEIYKIVENDYTQKYLNTMIPLYVDKYDYGMLNLKKQRNFYNDHLYNENLKTVVIISDALRYEAGVKLKEKLEADNRYDVKLDYMLTSLPSTTAVGMAALLPNRTLEITDEYDVLVDGRSTQGLKQRESILQSYDSNIIALQYKHLMDNKNDVIEHAKGKSIIYVYHNQIDAIGDDVKTESQIFKAVDDAIDDLERTVNFARTRLNVSNIIITADHGFIYTKSKNENFEKIDRFYESTDIINRRFILSNNNYDEVGVRNLNLQNDLDIKSEFNIHVPLSYYVFKMSGGGQNYYHGGMSPQENIVPLIKIKAEKGRVETEKVEVSVLSRLNRINSLIVKLEMLQNDSVGDRVVGADFNLYFEDSNRKVISNKINYRAHSQEKESRERITPFTFHLENRKYDSKEVYYFVVQDNDTKIENRLNVQIDIAFANDFDW